LLRIYQTLQHARRGVWSSSVFCVVSFAFSSVNLNFSVFSLVYLHRFYQTKSARTGLFSSVPIRTMFWQQVFCAQPSWNPDTKFYLAMDGGTNLVIF